MRVVVQRVSQSNVKVSGEIIGEINEGLMVLVSFVDEDNDCLLYTSPSPRDLSTSRMPSSA